MFMKIKTLRSKYIIRVCLLFLTLKSFSQTPILKNYSIKDGLPSSETYRVHKDYKGYIWIVSDMGVSRFDGYKFQNYTSKDGLPNNTVLGIYEDYQNRIWFWTLSGELAYFKNEKIHPLKSINIQLKKHISKGIINSISIDKNDTIHIGTFNVKGLFKVAFNMNKSRIIIDTTSKNGIYIDQIKTKKREATISLNSKTGLGSAAGENNRIPIYLRGNIGLNHTVFLNHHQYFSNPNQKCIRLNNGTILFTCDNLIYAINKQNQLSLLKKVQGRIIYLKEDPKGNVWVGTWDYGALFFPKGDLSLEPTVFLSGNSVSSIDEDQEGGLWFSTLENGIFYLSNQQFSHYSLRNGLKDEKINAVDIDLNGIIWTGSLKGHYTSIRNNSIHNFRLPPENIEPIIYQIHCDNNGVVYIGGSAFYSVNSNKTLKNICAEDGIFLSTSFCKSKYDNTVWSGSYGRIIKIKNGKATSTNTGFRINSICEGKKDEIFIGEINGLWSFKNRQLIYLGNNHSLLNNRIDDIKYHKQILFLATKGKGLVIKEGERIYQISEKNGLSSDNCKSVCIDDEGIVWVGTNKGLSRIIFKTKGNYSEYNLYNFTTVNGLISNEINQVVVKGNKVYVATNKGVTIFDKNSVKINQTAPPIYITKLLVNNRILPLKKKYNLTYNQNTFQISFIGLNYQSAGNVEYKYRIMGIDTNWHYTKYTRLDFTTLPHGDYTFEIYAKNNDGFWSRKPAILDISIEPPIWQTWRFRIFFGLILFFSIFFFARYRIQLLVKREREKTALYKKAAEQEKEKSELLQKASEMEMKFLSAQMNPHFTFNAMNSIQHFMLDHEPEKAQHYLAQYAKLIRRVLENNMEKFVPLDDELDMLEIYMEIESMRFSTPFEFEINVCKELEEKEYQIPPMILQPYVENAIWHGIFHKKEGVGKLTLSFSLEEDRMKCVIEDNGIGRKKAKEFNSSKKEHRSVGMLITQERLKHLQSDSDLDVHTKILDIVNENGEVCGTKVEVCLPLNSHPSVQK